MANTAQIGRNLQDFNFESLFNELGWSRSADRLPRPFMVIGKGYERRQIANLSGVAVFEINSPNGEIPDRQTRRVIHTEISKIAHENVLIFLDENRTQSLWMWVKREKGKTEIREHDYFKGQPVDL